MEVVDRVVALLWSVVLGVVARIAVVWLRQAALGVHVFVGVRGWQCRVQIRETATVVGTGYRGSEQPGVRMTQVSMPLRTHRERGRCEGLDGLG